MAKTIDKIVQQSTAPKNPNVLWDNGENLKIQRNGVWENTNKTEVTEVDGEKIKESSIPLSALSEEIKNNMGGADWNAQEGEAGYIENKTHGIIWNKKPEDVNFNNLLLELRNKTPEIIIEDSIFKATYRQVNELEDMMQGFMFFKKNLESYYDYTSRFSKTFTFENITGQFEIDYDDYEEVYITIQFNDENITINEVLTIIDERYYVVSKRNFDVHILNLDYIPDIFIKTTPQTLSNTDKNRALANLGIDPVVWKYICNPYIVEYDSINYECNNAIPKELSDIIYQNNEFNHLVLSTILIKIHYLSEEAGTIWKVERVTSYDNEHVTFDDIEFGYDPNTRLFVV